VDRDYLYETFKRNHIYCRRYFYPLISRFPFYRNLPSAKPENLPVAEKLAKQVLCLPIYPDLTEESQNKVIQIIKNTRTRE
jgi:dTDP-4-amino-4,6-dideoxygalactose transaminase